MDKDSTPVSQLPPAPRGSYGYDGLPVEHGIHYETLGSVGLLAAALMLAVVILVAR